jgi:DNA-binding NarL/FixJ family response regulator
VRAGDTEQRQAGFLVVEDDELVARWLVRVFSKFRPTTHARTISEAKEIIGDRSRALLALVSDMNLPDGLGLDIVRYAREQRSGLAVLVLTGNTQPRIVNNSFLLGASFLTKPTTEESLEVFARKALATEGVEDTRILRVLEIVAAEWSLTDRESELLTLAASDRARADLAAALGVSENTAKTQVKNLLRKAGARNLDHAVRIVLRRALTGESSSG